MPREDKAIILNKHSYKYPHRENYDTLKQNNIDEKFEFYDKHLSKKLLKSVSKTNMDYENYNSEKEHLLEKLNKVKHKKSKKEKHSKRSKMSKDRAQPKVLSLVDYGVDSTETDASPNLISIYQDDFKKSQNSEKINPHKYSMIEYNKKSEVFSKKIKESKSRHKKYTPSPPLQSKYSKNEAFVDVIENNINPDISIRSNKNKKGHKISHKTNESDEDNFLNKTKKNNSENMEVIKMANFNKTSKQVHSSENLYLPDYYDKPNKIVKCENNSKNNIYNKSFIKNDEKNYHTMSKNNSFDKYDKDGFNSNNKNYQSEDTYNNLKISDLKKISKDILKDYSAFPAEDYLKVNIKKSDFSKNTKKLNVHKDLKNYNSAENSDHNEEITVDKKIKSYIQTKSNIEELNSKDLKKESRLENSAKSSILNSEKKSNILEHSYINKNKIYSTASLSSEPKLKRRRQDSEISSTNDDRYATDDKILSINCESDKSKSGKKEKSTDCDSALIPLHCVHG